MKKILVISLILMVVLTINGDILASEKGKLLIWADANRYEIVNQLGEEFQKNFEVPVKVKEKSFSEIRDSMRVEALSGEGPDIIVGAHDWLGQLVANNFISPIDLSGIKDYFMKTALKAYNWDGKFYGLPYSIESIGLIYNKNIISNPPNTFKAFSKLVRKNTNKKKEQYGFLMPQPDPIHTYPFMSAMGGYVFNKKEGSYDKSDIGLNNKGAIKGLKKLEKLYKKDLVPFVDYQTMMKLFLKGKVAMMITGPWAFDDLKEANIDYGVTQLPKIKGKNLKPFVAVQGFMISAFSNNKELAQTFLRKFIARKDTMLKLYKESNRQPVYKPAIEVAKENSDTAGILKNADNGSPMPSIPAMNSVWTHWEDALENIFTQKQDIKTSLDNAVNKIKTEIKNVNR